MSNKYFNEYEDDIGKFFTARDEESSKTIRLLGFNPEKGKIVYRQYQLDKVEQMDPQSFHRLYKIVQAQPEVDDFIKRFQDKSEMARHKENFLKAKREQKEKELKEVESMIEEFDEALDDEDVEALV